MHYMLRRQSDWYVQEGKKKDRIKKLFTYFCFQYNIPHKIHINRNNNRQSGKERKEPGAGTTTPTTTCTNKSKSNYYLVKSELKPKTRPGFIQLLLKPLNNQHLRILKITCSSSPTTTITTTTASLSKLME